MNIKSEIKRIGTDIISLCETEPALNVAVHEELNEKVYALITSDKPKIMVYGIYNAGKSTLINAMCGKQIAEVRDCPTTYKIDEFDAGNYVLVDSPGVDAPVEHEMVTNDYLSKCNVILYVISTRGGFESIKNYQNMYKLMQMDKPFIIVINDKEGAKNLNSDKGIQDIKYKILENLRKVSGNSHIDSCFDIIPVNGKRGFDSCIKQQPKLYELSNISFLKDKINYFLDTKKAMAIFAAPIGNLLGIVDQILNTVQQEILEDSGDQQLALKKIQQKRYDILEELPASVNAVTMRQISLLNQSAVSENVSQWEQIIRSIEKEFSGIFSQAMESIKVLLNHTGIDFDISRFTFASESMGTIGEMPVVEVKKVKQSQAEISSAVPPIGFSNGTAFRTQYPPDMSGLLKIIEKMIGAHCNKKREAEIEEYRELQARAERQNREAVEMANAEASRRQEIRIYVETTLHNIATGVTKELTHQISSLFDELEKNMMTCIAKNKQAYQEKQEFIAKLHQIRKEIEVLKSTI